MKKEVINELLFDLGGLSPYNVDEKFNSLYWRWMFDNSDEVRIDGELIDKKTKMLIKMAGYKINPEPKEIFVSETKNGFKLTEQMFIKKITRKLSNFTDADYPDNKWQMRIDFFLEYLSKRLTNVNSHDTQRTNFICDQKHLQRVHADFDGEIWESVELNDFLDSMRIEPISTLKPQVKNEEFAKWIFDNIETNRIGKPDMNKWFKKLVGKQLNYSTLKNM